MLSEVSISTTVAPAPVVVLAELPPLKNGLVNAMTIRTIAKQRMISNKTL